MFRNLFLSKKSILLVAFLVFASLLVQSNQSFASYGSWGVCDCSADATDPKTDGIQTRTKSSGTCAARPAGQDLGECERVCVCNLSEGYRLGWDGLDENSNTKADFSE